MRDRVIVLAAIMIWVVTMVAESLFTARRMETLRREVLKDSWEQLQVPLRWGIPASAFNRYLSATDIERMIKEDTEATARWNSLEVDSLSRRMRVRLVRVED